MTIGAFQGLLAQVGSLEPAVGDKIPRTAKRRKRIDYFIEVSGRKLEEPFPTCPVNPYVEAVAGWNGFAVAFREFESGSFAPGDRGPARLNDASGVSRSRSPWRSAAADRAAL
ncbi:hypothetical protein FK268_18475 [Tsukamurella sputi]|uniref:Uncharacterized protein n=1 Tax=Tsukamurella sputi TaxID=2591848 RepID=A0A5C5RJS8_9ACTN|nr:hypothetical protein [Tsukamurella sputi]TWS22713.1 hypothetical protein FK268_18475 [Tsukamurella sputi]